MPVDVAWVSYGPPALSALREAITAGKADDALAPVTVVVPSNHVGVATRRLLASGTHGPISPSGAGLAAVSFLTVYRLAELLGAGRVAAGGRRPVSTPVIAAALRSALERDPGVFAPVAQHPATESALVAAYKELRDVSPGALDALAAQKGKVADVVRLHGAARSLLHPRFSDEEDLLAAACAELDSPPGTEAKIGTVVVYLPQQLSLHAANFLASVGKRTNLTVLAGSTGDTHADTPVVASVRRIAPDAVAPQSDVIGRTGAAIVNEREGPRPGTAARSEARIVVTSDPDEEVRAAVREVIAAARSGTPLERIGILYATHAPYARLVHEQLAAAGIAHSGASVVPVASRAAGRTIVGLLALPASRFRRSDVFAWLAGAPMHHDSQPVPVAAWERVTREAGVVAGRDDWDHLLAGHAAAREAEAAHREAEGSTGPPNHARARARDDAARAREIRRFMLGLIDDLARAAADARSWPEHCTWARNRMKALIGDADAQSAWPVAQQQAAQSVAHTLDRLARLCDVEGPVRLDVFARTLNMELDGQLAREGRIGHGVLVGTVPMGVGLPLDLVIVLGLVEGSYPARVHDDVLLDDAQRQVAGGDLALRTEAIAAQHHDLLATLAGAGRHVLCIPRGDLRRGGERAPSRWVNELASSWAGRPIVGGDLLETAEPWIEDVPSFEAGIRMATFPATSQEHRLQALLAGRDSAANIVVAARRIGDDAFTSSVEAAIARHSSRLTRFDGNLAGLDLPSPVDGVSSASRIETWAQCPFSYFVTEVLGAEAVENPEDRWAIDARDRGELVHGVLESFMREVLARPPEMRPQPDDPWTDADAHRLQEITSDACDSYERAGLVGRPIFWHAARRRIAADLMRFLEKDSAYRAQRRARPVAAELPFGLPGAAIGTVELALGDGRSLRLRGKADRLDSTEGGGLHVIDYKTGRADRFADIGADNPGSGGKRIQLVVYALAARLHQGSPAAPVHATYWFTSAKENFRQIGYPVSDEVLAQVGAEVGRVVHGIESGVFPPSPDDREFATAGLSGCPYCDPDALGTGDLARRMDRKKLDPAVASFFLRPDTATSDGAPGPGTSGRGGGIGRKVPGND